MISFGRKLSDKHITQMTQKEWIADMLSFIWHQQQKIKRLERKVKNLRALKSSSPKKGG